MNASQFIEEVMASEICPDNFEEMYGEFQTYQKAALDTLYDFHRVCEKNKIPYFVQYGSLLGLIRDGGQIPWDYDVDVVVPYVERRALIEALENDLDGKYYYYSIEKDKKCRHMILRLAPKGYKTESLHVDVFFYIGTPDDEDERKIFEKKIKEISVTRFYRYVDVREETVGNIKRKIAYILRKMLAMTKNMGKMMDEYYAMCDKYDVYISKVDASADCFALVDCFESKILWNTTTIKTSDGHELRIPIEFEKVLEAAYGDYKKIFPLEDRLKELKRHYDKLHRQNHHLEDK